MMQSQKFSLKQKLMSFQTVSQQILFFKGFLSPKLHSTAFQGLQGLARTLYKHLCFMFTFKCILQFFFCFHWLIPLWRWFVFMRPFSLQSFSFASHGFLSYLYLCDKRQRSISVFTCTGRISLMLNAIRIY